MKLNATSRGFRTAATSVVGRSARVYDRAVLDGSTCPACGRERRVRIASWSAQCEGCGSWGSDLEGVGSEIDTPTRAIGFEHLRRENFRLVLSRLEGIRTLRGATLLDVGSAYGWFLQEARQRGAFPVGI